MADKYNLQEFRQDTAKLGILTADFVNGFFPAYCVDGHSVASIPQENSLDLLNSFTFYRISECKVYDVEDKYAYFAQKMQQLFTTAYSIKQEVCYGIVSDGSSVSLVIGVAPQSDNSTVKIVLEGLLPGIKLEEYKQRFTNPKIDNSSNDKDRYVGCISGTPALKIDGELERKDLSAMIRSLNGMSYTIMVMCKPVDEYRIQEKINEAIRIQDECFAISKRTLSYQNGTSDSNTHTEDYHESDGTQESKTKGSSIGINISGTLSTKAGVAAGAAAGAALGTVIPGVGNVIGAIGGGIVGLIVGTQLSFNKSKTVGTSHSISEGYSDAVTHTISENQSISGDVQNGFALEMMKMAESLVERLKIGRSIGMWESVVSFSSDSEIASKIIQGSLYNNMASGIPEILPPVVFSYTDSLSDKNCPTTKIHTQQLMIPKGFFYSNINSPLLSLVTSEEICGICNIPVDTTFGFNIEEQRGYALNYIPASAEKPIGLVCEYEKPIINMPFGLSDGELNKHTFVCGITGSGKTNSVKRILETTDKPFLVIEPAKKEYRNINKDNVTVLTLGRPEINCIRLNPFYILPGVSPQQHIDLLKDLFSASFAFYGPMPYIIEKCLYNIYTKRGWNLTLGFHPLLSTPKRIDEMFDADKIQECYAKQSHIYLFPTMQDLKDEIENYLLNDKEMTYEGEVKGNIQGALRARINSLCVGSKGYMFNTNAVISFEKLLENNVVIELEGLADDADKAFALGLLIMYINEYRQVQKEIYNTSGLQHLLVIEEAHRLLKNVSSEHTEELGNPKGKAVEHFTNMLAEMRSYGQGVIVAEQIPGKISPDVIKNSSNKIIHRIVSMDDQEIIANTVGLSSSDAIYLGNSRTGYAICHKEGMIQPVIIKVDEVTSKTVTDKELYDKKSEDKMLEINVSVLKGMMSQEIDTWAVRTLFSLMYNADFDEIYNGLERAYNDISQKARSKAITLVNGIDLKQCVMVCIKESLLSLMSGGSFATNKMIENDFIDIIDKVIVKSQQRLIGLLPNMFERYYSKSSDKKAIELVAALVTSDYVKGTDVKEEATKYLLIKRADFGSAVYEYLRRR